MASGFVVITILSHPQVIKDFFLCFLCHIYGFVIYIWSFIHLVFILAHGVKYAISTRLNFPLVVWPHIKSLNVFDSIHGHSIMFYLFILFGLTPHCFNYWGFVMSFVYGRASLTSMLLLIFPGLYLFIFVYEL